MWERAAKRLSIARAALCVKLASKIGSGRDPESDRQIF
ncbi:hypothetical protein [Pedobacter sp. SYSU D00535]